MNLKTVNAYIEYLGRTTNPDPKVIAQVPSDPCIFVCEMSIRIEDNLIRVYIPDDIEIGIDDYRKTSPYEADFGELDDSYFDCHSNMKPAYQELKPGDIITVPFFSIAEGDGAGLNNTDGAGSNNAGENNADIITTVAITRHRSTCTKCGAPLKTLRESTSTLPTFLMFDDALECTFSGGYGYYIDSTAKAILCRHCADELAAFIGLRPDREPDDDN